MTARVRRLDPQELLVGLAFGLVAVGIGVIAGVDSRLAVAGAVGVGFLLLGLASLPAGLAAFTLILFLDLAPVGGEGGLSMTKLAGAVLALSWLARVTTNHGMGRQLWVRFPGIGVLLAAILSWSLGSSLWAEDPGAAVSASLQLALNAALLVIAFEAVRSAVSVRWVMAALVAGSVAASVYGLVERPDASEFAYSPTSGSELGRLAGSIGDPNYLAALLVVGLVIALAMAISARSPAAKWTLLVGAGVCATGIFLTGSRGGLVALGGALVATVLLASGRRWQMLFVAATIAVSAVGYYAYIAPPEARDRLFASDGGAGRTDVWTVGMRIVDDRAAVGVGAGNFRHASIHYLHAEPGGFEYSIYIVDQPTVAHNTYLEFAAELGLPGLVLLLALVLAALTCAARASRLFRRSGEHELALLAAAVAVAITSFLTASIFLSAQNVAQLWLLLAMGPAMLQMARAGVRPHQAGDERESSKSR